MKNIRIFYLEIFPFLVVKFSIYLNRHVFVMCRLDCNLVRNDSHITEKNPVSRIFMGRKKLVIEKNIPVYAGPFGQMWRYLRI